MRAKKIAAGGELLELVARVRHAEEVRPLSPAAQIWSRQVAGLSMEADARALIARGVKVTPEELEALAARLELLHLRDARRRRRGRR